MKKLIVVAVLAIASMAKASPIEGFMKPGAGPTYYNAVSYAATTITLTTKSFVIMSNNGGPAAGYKFLFTNSVTPPSLMVSGRQGNYCSATQTSQVWPVAPPAWLHIVGDGGVTSAGVQIDGVQ